MNQSELRSLARRFAEGEVIYADFREQFVREYLSILRQDADIARDVDLIEHACADFDEGDISEQELRDELSLLANSPIISFVLPSARSESRSSEAFYIKELVA